MKCPQCHGRGIVTRRLLFITWERPCAYCNGTGKAGVQRREDSWRDDDWRHRPDDSYSSPSTAAVPERDEAFAAGSGGHSGGAGGGASWGDPVIVDPFAADASSGTGATAAQGASTAEAGGSDTGGSESGASDSGGSDSGSGTSY